MPVFATHSERYLAARCVDGGAALGAVVAHLGTDGAAALEDAEAHAALSVAVRLFEAGRPVSRSTVRLELIQAGAFFGDEAYGRLLGAGFEEEDLAYHLEAVAQAHAIRKAHAIFERGAYQMQNGISTPEKIGAIGEAAASLLLASEEKAGETGEDIASDIEAMLDRTAERRRVRHTSMFRSLNGLFRGYTIGRLAIIAAETNHGKSTFADWEAINTARRCHASGEGQVLIYDIENTPEEKARRIVSMLSGVATPAIEDHMEGARWMTEREEKRVAAAAAELRTLPLRIAQESSSRAIYADAYARSLSVPVSLVVVDYAQILHEPGGTLREQIIHGTQHLHQLARTLHCPVLLCSQVTLPKDYSGPPRLKDLAESSALKNFAATVLSLYHAHTEWGQKGHDLSTCEYADDEYTVSILKHKGPGAGRRARLFYDPRTLRIADTRSII